MNYEKTMTRIHDKLSECVLSITVNPAEQLRGQALNRLCDQLYVGLWHQTREIVYYDIRDQLWWDHNHEHA